MPKPHPPLHSPLLSARHKRAIALSLLVAAALYLLIVINTGYTKLISTIARLDSHIWLLLLGSSLLSYLLRFLRWQFFLRRFGHTLPGLLHFSYYLAGFALTTTPGKAGEVIRSVLLRPHAVPYAHSLACFFTERLLDVVVIALLALLTVLAFDGYTGFVVGASLGVMLIFPILRCRRCHAWLRLWQRRVRWRRVRLLLWHLLSLIDKSRSLLAWRNLYPGLLLGLLAWSVQGIAFLLLLQYMGSSISLWVVFGIYATSLLIGAASFLPGGVGSTELAMYLLLKASGVEDTTALSIPLISRLTTLWFAVSLGLLATTFLSARRQVTVHAS